MGGPVESTCDDSAWFVLMTMEELFSGQEQTTRSGFSIGGARTRSTMNSCADPPGVSVAAATKKQTDLLPVNQEVHGTPPPNTVVMQSVDTPNNAFDRFNFGKDDYTTPCSLRNQLGLVPGASSSRKWHFDPEELQRFARPVPALNQTFHSNNTESSSLPMSGLSTNAAFLQDEETSSAKLAICDGTPRMQKGCASLLPSKVLSPSQLETSESTKTSDQPYKRHQTNPKKNKCFRAPSA